MRELTWTTSDGAHSSYIGNRTILQADGGPGSMPFARCRCGWEGPSRLRYSAAVQDAMDHLTAMTHA